MPIVIKKGRQHDSFTMVCKWCDCHFSYLRGELRGGGAIRHIDCPECKKTLKHEERGGDG